MSFIEIGQGFADAAEPQIVPEEMYDLVISKATHNADKNNVLCIIEIENAPDGTNPASIFHYVNLPKGEDDAKDAFSSLMIKRLLTTFEVPFEDTGFDPSDLVGATASNCLVGQDEYEGRVKNVLKLPALED